MAWLVILLLIGVNALYVVAEFAAVALRATQLQPLAQRGDRRAAGLLAVLQDGAELDRYVAACQIGITLSSLVVGAYGQATVALQLAPLFQRLGGLQPVAAHSAAAIVVLVLLTVLQVLFGELVPKALALQFTVKAGLLTYPPMRLSLKLYAGFLKVLNGSGLLLLRLFGVKPGGHRHIHSPEELDLLIAESHQAGVLAPEEQRRLHSALTLGERTAADLMVPRKRIAALDITTSPDELLRRAIASPYTRMPVYQGSLEKMLGIVHTKDIASHFARHGTLPPLRDVLRPLPTVRRGVKADQLLTLLRERRATQALVVNRNGRVEGLVSLEDVLEALLGRMGDELKPAMEPAHA
ncbi:hemolysin family protein [Archangium lipolyticum]|uniref:hemolysin family protein n=1 Tax=Archangium lipolyticum TaxID=2970465 RepID=UPI002149C03C|nr:hemolysin family protein [Archangium lipolyticum]